MRTFLQQAGLWFGVAVFGFLAIGQQLEYPLTVAGLGSAIALAVLAPPIRHRFPALNPGVTILAVVVGLFIDVSLGTKSRDQRQASVQEQGYISYDDQQQARRLARIMHQKHAQVA